MGEVRFSQAEADYRVNDEDEIYATVTIFDYGATPGMVEGLAFWANTEIDNEGDDGYQKTLKIGGHSAMESYENESKNGTLTLVVNGRFLINIDTTGLDPKVLKAALESIDLKALEKLAG